VWHRFVPRPWLLGGGFTSKRHGLADALIDLPERAPNARLADKGYDADAIPAAA